MRCTRWRSSSRRARAASPSRISTAPTSTRSSSAGSGKLGLHDTGVGRGALHRRLFRLWPDRRGGGGHRLVHAAQRAGTPAPSTCRMRASNCAPRATAHALGDDDRPAAADPGARCSPRPPRSLDGPCSRASTGSRPGAIASRRTRALLGPDPSIGGGQFWLVLAGTPRGRRIGVSAGQFLPVRRPRRRPPRRDRRPGRRRGAVPAVPRAVRAGAGSAPEGHADPGDDQHDAADHVGGHRAAEQRASTARSRRSASGS